MSFEGYNQCICKNGHYFETDPYWYEERPNCSICGAKAAWINVVDETNGPPQGKIEYEDLVRLFIKEPGKKETCNLGHEHVLSLDIFRIPTYDETQFLRQYYQDGRDFLF